MLYVFAPTGNAAHGYKFCGWSISDPRWTLIQIKDRCLGRKNLNPAVLGKASRSELGQKRRFDHLPATSGLPRGTDIVGPTRLVRFVPRSDISGSKRPPLRQPKKKPPGTSISRHRSCSIRSWATKKSARKRVSLVAGIACCSASALILSRDRESSLIETTVGAYNNNDG